LIKKHVRFFWLDIYVGGKQVRRSLKTGNKFEALDRYKEAKDKLQAEQHGEHLELARFVQQLKIVTHNQLPQVIKT
jgi:hypothetical protein